jgi:hypothetical protein
MALELIAKFSVVEKVENESGKDLYEGFLQKDETVRLSYKHVRDRVVFTDKQIIAINVKGLTGTKKEFRFFPFSKISSFSVETAGTFDVDSDFKIWASGVGCFEINFGPKCNIMEIGQFMTERINNN